MSAKTPKEVLVMLLSDVRQNTQRAAKVYQEIGQMAQDPQIKEALEARAFVSQTTLEKLDQCFKLIGEQPVKLTGRLQEIFVEDFREELNEIQSPVAMHLFILAKINHLTYLRIGEYAALVAAADVAAITASACCWKAASRTKWHSWRETGVWSGTLSKPSWPSARVQSAPLEQDQQIGRFDKRRSGPATTAGRC